MLLLLNSDYRALKKLNRFLSKVWASRHKIYLTAIFTYVVLKLYNNKNLRNWFKFFYISMYELNSRAYKIGYIRKEQKFVKFAATQLKAASYGTFSHYFCLILKNIRLASKLLNMALERYITFLTKQWCKALKGAGPSPGFHCRGCHIFKYNIGCRQTGGQTWNGGVG